MYIVGKISGPNNSVAWGVAVFESFDGTTNIDWKSLKCVTLLQEMKDFCGFFKKEIQCYGSCKNMNLAKQLRIQAKNGCIIIKGVATPI